MQNTDEMGSTITVAVLILLGFLLFAALMLWQVYKRKKFLMGKIRRTYGQWPEREYDYDEFDAISHYHRLRKKGSFEVDDTTWNDLDMDRIFMLLNHTWSCIGESYLYSMLRMPVMDVEILKERERLTAFFQSHPKERERLEYEFAKIGKTGRYSVFDYIYNLADLKPASIWPEIGWIAGVTAAFCSIFLNAAYGVLLFLAVLAASWSYYYQKKKKIAPYILSCSCLVQVLKVADGMGKMNLPELSFYQNTIRESKKKFRKLRRNTFFVVSSGDGLEKLLVDYLNYSFHLDLIQFHTVIRELSAHMADLEKLIDAVGNLECATAIASFRTLMETQGICTPHLFPGKGAFLKAENLYHPLIEQPVKNSIEARRGVLLTGSNASGKSTFLKTVALNAILAQTIDTCLADRYEGSFFKIYTSMALRDDLVGQESYFIVEIKSLKRILDAADGKIPLLCFVDEVLRGTNTVERIAASAEILQSMERPDLLCFAATHDIELTHLLEKGYDNYHFQEEVRDHDILFNYRLFSGRAVSRNAIRLLGMMGYAPEIIEEAEKRAEYFVKTGEWK